MLKHTACLCHHRTFPQDIQNYLCIAAGKIEGDIRVNGFPKVQSTFARVAGYVEQFDTHTAATSVHEALLFSGTLRNGKEVDRKKTQEFVQQVILSLC